MAKPENSSIRRSSSQEAEQLSATLTAIVQGHKQSQIDEQLRWKYAVTV